MNSIVKDEAIDKIINSSVDKVAKLLIFMAGMQAQDDITHQPDPEKTTA